MFRKPLLSLSILILSSVSHSAFAAVTIEQAEQLKSLIQGNLDYQKEVNEAIGETKITYEGELKAEPSGDFVAVTLPHITVESMKEAEKNKVDLGVITLNGMPDGSAGDWKVTLTLPKEISIGDGSSPVLKIQIPEQNTTGVLSKEYGYFTNINLNLGNITATEDGTDLGLNIAKISGLIDMKPDENGLHSGPVNVHFENVNIKSEDSALSIGNIGLDGNVYKYKPIKLSDFKNTFLKHKDTFAAMGKAPDDKASEEASPQAVTDMLFDIYNFEFDGIDTTLSVKNVTLDTFAKEADAEGEKPEDGKTQASAEQDKNEKFTVADAHIGYGLHELSSDKSKGFVKFGFSGVSLSPTDPQYDGIIPTDYELSITHNNMPAKSLFDLLKNTISSAVSTPEMATFAGMGLLAKLPALLTQSGFEIDVSGTHIKSSLYDAKIDGKIVADIASVLSFKGNLSGQINGLDEVIKKVQDNSKREDAYSPEEYKDMVATLETIKNYGKSNNSMFGGSSSYLYDIALTPDGKLTINGKNVDFMPQPTKPIEKVGDIGATPATPATPPTEAAPADNAAPAPDLAPDGQPWRP